MFTLVCSDASSVTLASIDPLQEVDPSVFDISLPRRASVVAACLGAMAVLGTAPALAVTSPGENIFGSGASLQSVAQQNVWTANWSTTPTDQSTLSGGPFTATYTTTSSGQAMDEFGNNTGTLDLTQDPTADNMSTNGYLRPVLDAYGATDDPPTGPLSTVGTNLADASAAATGSAATKIDEITVPADQTPVVILISLPTGITAGGGSHLKLTNTLLRNIYDANVPTSAHYPAGTWGALLEGAGWTLVTGAPGRPASSPTRAAAPVERRPSRSKFARTSPVRASRRRLS